MQKDRITANHKQHFENTIKIDNMIKMEIIRNTEDLLNQEVPMKICINI